MPTTFEYWLKEGQEIDLSRFPQDEDRVVFTGKGGYDWEQNYAKDFLVVGEAYTVVNCRVGMVDHRIEVREVPGKSFNGVLFEKVNNVSS